MRKIIICFCILLATLSLKAQTISGISVDGGNIPILVYIGGNQMCLPSTSCFIANLRPDYYTVEVYATRRTRPGERVWKGERLYTERIYFNGNGVKYIQVGGMGGHRPDRPDQGDHRPEYGQYDRVMSSQLFDTFFNKMKNEPFSSDRLKMLEAALVNTDFTCGQCLRLVKLYSFDDDKMKIMKLMYPRIVDREAFFTVIDVLTFSSNKDEMNEFVKNYSIRR